MAIPSSFQGCLELPLVSAPMFLISGPDLVVGCCKNGVVGTFPALNARTSEGLDEWLEGIGGALDDYRQTYPGSRVAPYGVNLIVHKSNQRLEADLELCIKHKVPLIITSLGAVSDLVDQVHAYGGLVFHDVINLRHAQKAAEAGVDGLILVSAGAGGHAGKLNPFALMGEIRQFFDKTILLSGCLSTGGDIAAAQMMGADMAYIGSRFINTKESMADDQHKQMMIDTCAQDIVYTNVISGTNANFIAQSLREAGFDPAEVRPDMDVPLKNTTKGGHRAWKQVWSAGQGVGSINDVHSIKELIDRFKQQYRSASDQWHEASKDFMS